MTLQDYDALARRCLKYYVKRFRKPRSIIDNTDFLSAVIEALVRADLSHDPNKAASLNTWRYQAVRNAIKSTCKINNNWYSRVKNISPNSFKEKRTYNNFNYDNKDLISKLIEGLPDKQKKVIQLKYLDGKTQVEISKTLGCTSEAVRQIRKRALRRMRKHAEEILS